MTLAYDIEHVRSAALDTVRAIDQLCQHSMPQDMEQSLALLREQCASTAAELDPSTRGVAA